MDCIKCHVHESHLSVSSQKAVEHTFANRTLPSPFDSKAFASREFLHSDFKYKFYEQNGKCKVEIQNLKDGSKNIYNAAMAIGLFPLIQYVIECSDGKFQVLSIAYDPQKDEFFDVFNNEQRSFGDWGHWLSGGMNWNSNCAYCHTTDFRKNFDLNTLSYSSKFTNQGVSCLQCHDAVPKECNQSLPVLTQRPSRKERMYACASCHSRREQLL